MARPDHQERVIVEKDELDAKLARLRSFIGNETYLALDEAEQSRLQRQAEVMSQYSSLLAERIAAF